MKPILIFRCNALLKPDVQEKIREDLKKQIAEGVIVTDINLEYVKTMLPKDCECDVVIENLEHIEIQRARIPANVEFTNVEEPPIISPEEMRKILNEYHAQMAMYGLVSGDKE